jgi:hypothetical protein
MIYFLVAHVLHDLTRGLKLVVEATPRGLQVSLWTGTTGSLWKKANNGRA